MKRRTALAASNLLYLIESRALLNMGACACGRQRDLLVTPTMKAAIDEFVAAFVDEPADEEAVTKPEDTDKVQRCSRTMLLDVD